MTKNASSKALGGIRFNQVYATRVMPYFQQELLERAQEKGDLRQPGYLAAKAECRRLARTEGIDKAMRAPELDAIIAPTHGTPAFTIDPIVAASLSVRFSGFYSFRKLGYVLHLAQVLYALGYRVVVTEAGQGLSRRGTSDAQGVSGDVLRRLLVQQETQIEVDEADLAAEEVGLPAGHLSKRESQRDAKSQVDACEAEVRGRGVTEQLLTWYRDDVEPSLLAYAVHPRARGEHLPRHAVYRPRVGPLLAVQFSYKAPLRICLVGIPALQCCRTRRNSRRAMNVRHALHVSDLEHREHVRSLFL